MKSEAFGMTFYEGLPDEPRMELNILYGNEGTYSREEKMYKWISSLGEITFSNLTTGDFRAIEGMLDQLYELELTDTADINAIHENEGLITAKITW